ncbi:MAG: stage III sporulation protein AD [Clostridia bacterium]|nr:stage III sporulation protein AD [Clostridia bacterium]
MTAVLTGIVGLLLCAALLAVVLRGQRPEIAMVLSLLAGILVMVVLLEQLVPLLRTLHRITERGGVETESLLVVLKAAGISLLTQLTADTCRDAGENALATKAELAGRVLLLTLAVPLFERILTLVLRLVQGAEVGG